MLLDTSIASDNVGDEIIVQAIQNHLTHILEDSYVTSASSHDGMGHFSRALASTADIVFMLGTNALSPSCQLNSSSFIWRVAMEDLDVLKDKVVLIGVGANRDYTSIDTHQLEFLNTILSRDYVHSTRDEAGKKLVESSGHAAVNTSCPTLWELDTCADRVPTDKSDTVCFTLTMHKRSPLDLQLLKVLYDSYDHIAFWPQQPRDLDYLESIADMRRIQVIPPSLRCYDAYLDNHQVDVIGTRLHGTIRGMQRGKRSIVISIDNRAREIAAMTGLPCVEREAISQELPLRIKSNAPASLLLPEAEIQTFLAQFLG
jgi:polysaccharide pyruvyl transferase WcaK-like protein